MGVFEELSRCRLCRDRFLATETRHDPRPVVQGAKGARILIAGQAPGMRVYRSGVPFDDASGDRLRDWFGVERSVFYDRDIFAIVPMAFCFPGYDARGADLAPSAICARVWRSRILEQFSEIKLMVLVGKYAQDWHLGDKMSVSVRVRRWHVYGEDVFPLPHPSWRNTGWIKRNDWFARDVLPALRARVKEVIG